MTSFSRAWRLPSVKLSLGILAVVLLVAVFGGWLAPYDPIAQSPRLRLLGPSGEHLLGTDYLGRDVLSRLLAGAGLSIAGAIEAVAVGLVLGAVPGLASIFFGRGFEWATARVADALLTLPFVVFAIAVAGIVGNGLHQAMAAIGLLLAPVFYRVTRTAALSFTRAQYVEAAELLGASRSDPAHPHRGQGAAHDRGDRGRRVRGGPAGRLLPLLPRHRRRTPGPHLGRDAGQRPGIPPPEAAGPARARPRDHDHRGRAQRPRRRRP